MNPPPPSFINWSINVYDLLLLAGCAILLYGRLVKIETQIEPIVNWWNRMIETEHQMGHQIGRRWTDQHPTAPPKGIIS